MRKIALPPTSITPLLSALVLITAAAYSLYRCQFGVDFTDEAQYVGQAYSSLIGGAPFESDLFIQQVVSILLIPIVALYGKFVGSSDGLVAFFRLVWWTFAAGTSALLYFRFRRPVGDFRAALIASLAMLFVPFNIPSPSYNSFGLIFLTLGLLTPAVASTAQLFCLGIATLAYPPFAVSLVGVLAFAFVRFPERRREWTVKFVGLAAAGIGIAMLAGFAFGWDRLRAAFVFSSAFGTFGTAEKFALWKSQIGSVWDGSPIYTNHYGTILLGLVGLAFIPRREGPIPRAYVAISALCGVLSGWASSNGILNIAIGVFPACLAVLAHASARARGPFATGVVTGGLVLIAVGYAYEFQSTVYRDQPIPLLTERVEWGPYRGLRTTPARAAFLDEFQSAIVSLDNGSRASILFLYSFPAGYLMSTLRPATRMLYLQDREYPEGVRHLLLPAPGNRPDYVVRLKSIPETFPLGPGDPELNSAFSEASGYKLVRDAERYLILKKGG